MAKTKKAATKVAAKSKGAVKKPAAKKPAKKTVAKKPVVKKPAAKPAAKKPAVKKPAKKPAVKKPAAKPAPKPAASKPAVKKPAPEKKPQVSKAVEKPFNETESDVKFRNLFDAFQQGKLPFAQGYIVSSFFNEKNAYSIYEIVSYAGVKEIFPAGTGLTFISGGKKLYILVENATYQSRHVEPMHRDKGESIPKRESELEIIIAKNQTRIMVAKEPNEITGSFTILKPASFNFAVVFYQQPDLYQSLADFFEDSLNRERKVPQYDAKKAAALISATVDKTMGFKGEFE